MGHTEIQMIIDGYSRTCWGERKPAASAVVGVVVNSDAKDDNQRQKEVGERHLLFEPKPEKVAIDARSGFVHEEWCTFNLPIR